MLNRRLTPLFSFLSHRSRSVHPTWLGNRLTSYPASLATSIVVCALSLSGCGSDADDPGLETLRVSFPEQADEVLGQREAFVETAQGFTRHTPKEAGLWLRVEADLPRDGALPFRLRVRDFEVEVREMGVEGEGRVVEQAVAYSRAGGTSYWTVAGNGLEEWLHLKGSRGEAVATWEVIGATLQQHEQQVALVDAEGTTRLWVSAPAAYADGGKQAEAQLRVQDNRIELWVEADGAEVLVDPLWTLVANTTYDHREHSALRLGDGRILITGGYLEPHSEVYDPSTNTWTSQLMNTSRGATGGTLLGNGKVLVAAGYNGGSLNTAEIFDPEANTWSFTSNQLTTSRFWDSQTLLGNGQLLVAGGYYLSSIDLYDPVANAWSASPPAMNVQRGQHTATRLGNGKVLVVGGRNLTSVHNSAELYDPATGWSVAASMASARHVHTATLLGNGKVLVTGGSSTTDLSVTLSTAELYTPDPGMGPGSWSSAGSMMYARHFHTATLLGNGKVLIAGGGDNGVELATAELYDPVTNTWTDAGSMNFPRRRHATATLSDGRVLVSGGDAGAATNSVDVYAPLVLGDACTQAYECASGFCADGVCCNTACNPGNPCDACSVAAGASVDGTCGPTTGNACNDSNACTQTDTCQAGVCTGTNPMLCDQCNDCNAATGLCDVPKSNGTACINGDLCTTGDTCMGGVCVSGGTVVTCAASDQCHDPGVCDPMTGVCSNPAKPDTTPCNDGNVCTNSETCMAGVCTAGMPVTCIPSDSCHDAACDPTAGCMQLPKSNTACNDGNLCTIGDMCTNGVCESGGTVVTCAASDQCHDPGVCDPMTGTCSNPAKSNGAACSDSNACTQSDTCQMGVCTGSNPVACVPSDACHDATCNPSDGACIEQPKVDGTPCVDSDQCTANEACFGGQCVGTPSCVPLGSCDEATCDPATGQCSHTPKDNCSPPDGGGPPPSQAPSDVKLCTSQADCPTGRTCVDGVCCNQPCDDQCYSCIVPGSIGQCAPSPQGVDLRDECFSGPDCFQTCDGMGNCVGADENTQCAPHECSDDVHLLTPAICSGNGAACPLGDRVPTSCAPYRCVKTLRACLTSCNSVEDCAPPFVCSPTHECVEAPSVESTESSGCACTVGSRGAKVPLGTLLFLLATALAAHRRRLCVSVIGQSLRSVRQGSVNRLKSALLLLLSLAFLGCGAEADDPAPGAVRQSFHQQAPQVLEHGEGFAATADGFAWKPAPEQRLWLSVEADLPRQGDGSIRLRVRDFEVEVREIGAYGPGQVIQQAVAYQRTGGTSYWTASQSGVEEWLHIKGSRGDVAAMWEVQGATLEQHGEQVALVDATGVARLWVSAPTAYAAGGQPVETTLAVQGNRIRLSVEADGADVLVDPVWTTTASMTNPRLTHTATLMNNGNVLVASGWNGLGVVASAEAYDPGTNTWSSANSMNGGRERATAAPLGDGRVVVSGGVNGLAVATTRLYDPLTNVWSDAANMNSTREEHTLTRLDNGKVLAAGGGNSSVYLSSVELYDPIMNTWSPVSSMGSPRQGHRAARLGDGKVLVAGGTNATGDLATAELYDPVTGSWSPTGNTMATGRLRPIAVQLGNGKVLVAGGLSSGNVVNSVDLYDPSTNTWSPAAPMLQPRTTFAAVLLANGKVLVTGGLPMATGSALAAAEVYDPATDSWSTAGSMGASRRSHTATLLPNGVVLVAGGGVDRSGGSFHDSSLYLNAAELFQQFAQGSACTSAGECMSGFCVDGFCCDTACDGGTCEACSVVAGAATDGTCAPLTGPACDDGNGCTQSDTCQAGLCTGSPVVCTAQDTCHDAGSCDPATGLCSNPSKADGATCDDGDFCTLVDTCQAGACMAGTPVTCAALDQCHDAGVCNPATGQCSNPNKTDGTICDDANLCTQTSTCQAGLCVGANPIVCSAPDACHDAGVCSPMTGQCGSAPQKPAGTLCDDGDLCTLNDACNATGTCAGTPMTCMAANKCQVNPGTCNAGVCSYAFKPNGDPCNDDNACTNTSTCQGGQCKGSNPVTCPTDPCYDTNTCDPASGSCVQAGPKPMDTPCNDGNKCTINDVCDATQQCQGVDVVCVAIDACHQAGSCDANTGQCSNPEIPDCELPPPSSDAGAPKVPTNALLCDASSDCPPNRPSCVDGICCDAPCSDKCYTCLRPDALGQCVPAQAGVDLNQDCGPKYGCDQTCDGDGQCVNVEAVIGGGNSVQCAPNECADDGIHVLGQGFCSGEGEVCPTSTRDAWSCAPYLCIKALGACAVRCESVKDCAPPFVCSPSNECVPPPSVESRQDSGCAVAKGQTQSPTGAWLVALMATVAAALRRHRRSR